MTSPFLGESPIREHRRSLPPASDPARLSANVRLERHYRGALSVLVVTMKTITDSGKSPQLKIRADSKSIRYPRGDRYSSSSCPFHGGQSPTQCSVQGKLDTLVCQILTNSNEGYDDSRLPSSRRSQVLLTELHACVGVPQADLANANGDVNRLNVHNR